MDKKTKQLLKETSSAITVALECWKSPDSPEAFCFAMKHLMILRDRINQQSCRQHENRDKTLSH
jgi:hypothetical protein